MPYQSTPTTIACDVTSAAFGSTRPHMPSTRHEINSSITKKQALRPSKKKKAPTSRNTAPGKTALEEESGVRARKWSVSSQTSLS